MIRAIDVRIGGFYTARLSGAAASTPGVVEIKEFISSCTWLARNTRTGGELYVLFADLIGEVSEPHAPTSVSAAAAAIDYRRRAAGDVD